MLLVFSCPRKRLPRGGRLEVVEGPHTSYSAPVAAPFVTSVRAGATVPDAGKALAYKEFSPPWHSQNHGGRTPISYISTNVRQQKEEQRRFNSSESTCQVSRTAEPPRLLRVLRSRRSRAQPWWLFSTAQAAHFLAREKMGGLNSRPRASEARPRPARRRNNPSTNPSPGAIICLNKTERTRV